MLAVLPLTTDKEILWWSQDVSEGSPVMSVSLDPSSARDFKVVEPRVSLVSSATGWKMTSNKSQFGKDGRNYHFEQLVIINVHILTSGIFISCRGSA